jgi:hypothetical protein
VPKVCTWVGSQRSAGTQVQLDTGGPGVITPAVAALVPREVVAVEVSAVVDVVVVLVVVVVEVVVVVDSAEVVVLPLLLVVVKG